MASVYIGASPGKTKSDVLVDTSTTSKKVELVIDTGVPKREAIKQVENILAKLKETVLLV